MHRTIAAIVLVIACGWIIPAHAMRCGNALVQEGDPQYRVLKRCGEPSYRDAYSLDVVPGVAALVDVEVWYYDFGPQSLIEVLHFENGTLTRITTAGYGFNTNPPRHCEPEAIRQGMTKYELLQTCGEPQDRHEYTEFLQSGNRRLGSAYIPVRIEEWTYDFGPGRLLRLVRLANGKVIEIKTK